MSDPPVLQSRRESVSLPAIARNVLFATLALLTLYAGLLVLRSPAFATDGDPIGTITVDEVCAKLSAGESLVFVDVREPREFAEEHLPGAINLPTRDMRERASGRLAGAETVVPYCLKDFRGFEGARRLQVLGFEDVRLLAGVGLKGWKERGLPTAGKRVAVRESVAWRDLQQHCGRASP